MLPGFGLDRANESRCRYHGGDLLGSWVYVGLAIPGIAVGAIALDAVRAAVVWAVLGRRQGRDEAE